MEMRILFPKRGTYLEHIPELASDHNRDMLPGTPDPYAETYPVRNPHSQVAKTSRKHDQGFPSASHISGVDGVGHDETPCERASSVITHRSLPKIFSSASAVCLEVPDVQDQRAAESSMRLTLSEAASNERFDQENLEKISLRENLEHPHTQKPGGERLLQTQPKSSRKSTAHHRPFERVSSCCSISRLTITPQAVQDFTRGSQTTVNTATNTRCELKGRPEIQGAHAFSRLTSIYCMEPHRSSKDC